MIKLEGDTEVILRNQDFGDSINLEFPKQMNLDSSNQLKRQRKTHWHGTDTFEFSVEVMKCHLTKAKFYEISEFLKLHNGKPIACKHFYLDDDEEVILDTRTGILRVTDAVENLFSYNIGFQLVTVV